MVFEWLEDFDPDKIKEWLERGAVCVGGFLVGNVTSAHAHPSLPSDLRYMAERLKIQVNPDGEPSSKSFWRTPLDPKYSKVLEVLNIKNGKMCLIGVEDSEAMDGLPRL